MNIEAKRNEIFRLILALQDESLIDSILKDLSKLTAKKQQSKANEIDENEALLNKYRHDPNLEFDLDKIMEEQNYSPPKPGEIDRLIKEADIQEPIEELLAMLTK